MSEQSSSAGQGQGTSQSQVESLNDSCLKALQCLYLYHLFDIKRIKLNKSLIVMDNLGNDIEILPNDNTIENNKKISINYALLLASLFFSNKIKSVQTKKKSSSPEFECNNEQIRTFINQKIENYNINIYSTQIIKNNYKTLIDTYFSSTVNGNTFLINFYDKMIQLDSNIQSLSPKELENRLSLNPNKIFFLQQQSIQAQLIEKLNAIGTLPRVGNSTVSSSPEGLFKDIQELIQKLPETNRETYTQRLTELAQQAGVFRQRLRDLGTQLGEYEALVAQIAKKDGEIAALLASLQQQGSQGTRAGGGYISEEKVKKSRGRPVKNVATIKKTSLKKTYKNAIAV